jgi:hypothetical protein
MYCYFYLIFAFWENIFRSAFPWDSDGLCLALIVACANYSYTYCASISSADSLVSAACFRSCGPKVGWIVTDSLPLVVVGSHGSNEVSFMVGLLEDGYYVCLVYVLSDRGIGAYVLIRLCCAGCGARIVVGLSYINCRLIYTSNVVCNSATSVCSCSTASTNLV